MKWSHDRVTIDCFSINDCTETILAAPLYDSDVLQSVDREQCGPCQQWLAHAIGSGTGLAVPRSSTLWNQPSILTHQNCHADLLIGRLSRSPTPANS